jgi:dinuclear metal center YbgI/SA1388 family protein
MKCKDLLKIIEHFYPINTALDFDNVGLLCGRYDKEVKKVYIALDPTDAVIDDAALWRADLLITHHPMILTPFKSVTDDDYIGRRLINLIQNDISYYAMHTNYDVMRLGELTGEILGLRNLRVLSESMSLEESNLTRGRLYSDPPVEGILSDESIHDNENFGALGIGVIGDLPDYISLKECCELVKDKFNLQEVKLFGDLSRLVKQVGVAPGSGRSTLPSGISKKIDVLVTGDIGHHEGLNGIDHELAIIDAGHYNTEFPFIEDMRDFILKQNLNLEVKTAKISTPYIIL